MTEQALAVASRYYSFQLTCRVKSLLGRTRRWRRFVCILGEEDVVYDVYVAAAAIDIRPTLKGTVGGGNATSELSWAILPPPYRTFANRTVPHPAVETRHK